MECCPLCPVTPAIFSRDHMFQGLLGVIEFLIENGEFCASAGMRSKHSALQMRQDRGHSVASILSTAELGAEEARAGLQGSTEMIARFSVVLQVGC